MKVGRQTIVEDEVYDLDVPCLPDTMRPVLCLMMDSRCPVEFCEDYMVVREKRLRPLSDRRLFINR
jgi:hypothetical protein